MKESPAGIEIATLLGLGEIDSMIDSVFFASEPCASAGVANPIAIAVVSTRFAKNFRFTSHLFY
jgi:hypothetical protein